MSDETLREALESAKRYIRSALSDSDGSPECYLHGPGSEVCQDCFGQGRQAERGLAVAFVHTCRGWSPLAIAGALQRGEHGSDGSSTPELGGGVANVASGCDGLGRGREATEADPD